jgi:hypothetical protein
MHFKRNLLFLHHITSSKEEKKISETIEFPKNFTIIGNLTLATWIALDTIAFLLSSVTVGIVFLLIALIGIYGILKFLGCLRPCYNCKKCTFGLGRLSALYFGKRDLKDYKKTYGFGVAIFFYALIGPLPAVLAVFSLFQALTIPKIIVTVILLIVSTYSAITWKTTTVKFSA